MAEATTSSQGTTLPRPANEGSSSNNFKDVNGNTPLHIAALSGKADIIKSLLSIGIGVDDCNNKGETALCLAASSGNEEAVEELLKGGADLSMKTEDGKTVWHHAASAGHAAILELLADYRIPAKKSTTNNKLDQESDSTAEVLDKVAVKESEDDPNSTGGVLVPVFQVRKPNVSSQADDRQKVSWENIYKFSDSLHIESGDSSEDDDFITNSDGLFHASYIHNKYQYIKEKEAELIKTKSALKKKLNGASMGYLDLKEKDEDGFTPLHHAVASGAETAVRRFLRKKADVNAKAENNITPFFLVGVGGSTKIYNMLLKAGADHRTVATGGVTPLHMAASWGSLQIVKKLLFIGADPNSKTFDGETPLHAAAKHYGNFHICKELIYNGADLSEVDLYGNTPFDVACTTGDDEMSHLLAFHEFLDSLDD